MKFLIDSFKRRFKSGIYTPEFVNRTAQRLVKKWLEEFKEYLPPIDASEHAKGAHDAVNDLLTWIALENISKREEKL